MVYTKLCSHPLPCTPTHSHQLPFTPTHFYSFLTHSYSFSALSDPLPLMFSSLLLILNTPMTMSSLSRPFPVHMQILTPNPTHHLPFQPIFSPCILHAYVLYILVCLPLCFTCPCAYVIHFYALYCLCLYTLRVFVCVNTSGLFIYTAFFKTYL